MPASNQRTLFQKLCANFGALLYVSILLGGCVPSPVLHAQSPTAIISGRVVAVGGIKPRDPGNLPGVSSTTVTLSNESDGQVVANAVTDGTGAFRFEVSPGRYIVSAGGTSSRIEVKSGERLELILKMQQTQAAALMLVASST